MENFIEIYNNCIKVKEATKKGYSIAEVGDSINLEQPNSKTRRGRIGKGVANTLTCSCNQGVVIEEEVKLINTNRIIKEILPIQVRVRKFKVDEKSLQECLLINKNKIGITIKKISEELKVPKTEVEHWFRRDKCFSVPNEDKWIELKNLLQINTDEFDESIMTFEIRDGTFEKTNRIYDENGVAPTITCTSAENERYKIYEKEKFYEDKLIQTGTLDGKHEQSNRIYSSNGMCPTIMAGSRKNCTGGFISPKILIENELIFCGGIGDKKWQDDEKDLSRNYPQGNRVYNEDGLSCTITSQGGGLGSYGGLYKIYTKKVREMNEPILIGGIGEINFGKQWRQGNRVYSSENISMSLMAQPVGNAGGNSYLYKVKQIKNSEEGMNGIINEGNYSPSNHNASRVINPRGISPTVMENHGTITAIKENGFISKKYDEDIEKYGYIPEFFNPYNCKEILGTAPTVTANCSNTGSSSAVLINSRGKNMWSNILKKNNYEMNEIRLFDAFAGKGALHKALKKLGVPVKVVGLSEIEPDAVIAYAGVHVENFKNMPFSFPEEEEMKKLLMERNIGWDFQKEKSSIPRMKKEKLKMLYKATILTNNLGDISEIDYKNMFNFDLFNLSFCCQDISNAGKQAGLKNEDGTHTRSGLIKFGLDIVKEKKPKFIMIENVKALIQKKFINDFYDIINEITSYGYKCIYPTKEDKKGNKTPCCLNAKHFGIPQNRERVFVICIRNDVDIEFEMPTGKDEGIRLKDLLEDNVEEKYYLSEEIQKRFKRNIKVDEDHNELNIIGSSSPESRSIGQRDITYGVKGVMSTLTATDYKQPKQILENNDEVCITEDKYLEWTSKAFWGEVSKEKENFNEIKDIGSVSKNSDSQAGKVYGVDGISQTLCAGTHGYAMGNISEPQALRYERTEHGKKIRKRYETGEVTEKIGDIREAAHRGDGISNTITTILKDNYILTPTIVASRGRNPNNPSDRTAGSPTEQRLEINKNGTSNTLTSVQKDNWVLEPIVDRIGGCFDSEGKIHQAGSVYNKDGVSPTVTTCEGGYRMPIVKENNIDVVGKLDCDGWFDIESRVNSTEGLGATVECKNRAKYIEENELKQIGEIDIKGNDSLKRIYSEDGISPTVTSMQGGNTHPKIMDFRIRKLTPLECWRLMGFDDDDFYRVKELNLSDSALYKLAGNSIVVNCLYYIFNNVFEKYKK